MLLSALLAGCTAVPKNKPVAGYPDLSLAGLQNDDLARPLRIGVQTTFGDGSPAVHVARANGISQALIGQFEARQGNSRTAVFSLVDTWATPPRNRYDLLLRLECGVPEHESRKNTGLLLVAWPATISILFSPLGVGVLSCRGIVREHAWFDWRLSIWSGSQFEAPLRSCNLPRMEAKVSATGWGTPDKVLEKSYRHADTHVVAAALDFFHKQDFPLLLAEARSIPDKEMIVGPAVSGGGPIVPLAGRKHAIVVGVSRYRYAPEKENGLADLEYADKDARDFHARLLKLGWAEENIKLLVNEDASEKNIRMAVKDWAARARSETLVVFWSGHAYPDLGDPERVFLGCHDTQTNRPSTAMRMRDLRQNLADHGAHNVLIIADTCHAGSIISRDGTKGLAVRPELEAMQARQEIPRGWIIVASAESDRKAYEDKSWANGALTHALLKGLDGAADGWGRGARDGVVTMEELKEYVRREMGNVTLERTGVKLEPLFYTTATDPAIWGLTLHP